MRIIHVVRQFHPAVGGLESVVLELSSAQIAQGHSVRVVTLNRMFGSERHEPLPSRGMTAAGAEIIRIPYFGSVRYPIALSVLRHVREADIVHVHCIDFFFDYLAWTTWFHGRTLVVSTHGGFFHTPFAAGLKQLYFSTMTRFSSRAYAAIAAVSEPDYALFTKFRHGGLACIENGVNTNKYADAAALIPTKAIISLCRLSNNKRLDRLIAFGAALRRLDPDWLLKIVGRPTDMGRRDVKSLAEIAGIGDAVEVIESASDDVIRDVMSRCSAFASASEYEGFGVAAIEAMSAGLFPILSDIPPHRTLVDRTGSGMIVEFNNAEEEDAHFLGKWEDLTAQRHRASLMKACRGFAWDKAARAYQELYEFALANRTRAILGVPIRVATFPEAVDIVDSQFAGGELAKIAFANANTINIAASNDRFREALNRSIVFNDGVGVDIASRLLFGKHFPDNLNGTDFLPKYLQHSRNRYRIFLLGAKPSIAARAAETLKILAPQHEIAGCRDGYYSREDESDVVEQVRLSKSDVLLVAMGNPKQELWLNDHFAATGCRLGFGVGGLFDFQAEQMQRAPAWVRSARLEWAYRVVQEPRRLWRRYFIECPAFLLKVVSQLCFGTRISNFGIIKDYLQNSSVAEKS